MKCINIDTYRQSKKYFLLVASIHKIFTYTSQVDRRSIRLRGTFSWLHVLRKGLRSSLKQTAYTKENIHGK